MLYSDKSINTMVDLLISELAFRSVAFLLISTNPLYFGSFIKVDSFLFALFIRHT